MIFRQHQEQARLKSSVLLLAFGVVSLLTIGFAVFGAKLIWRLLVPALTWPMQYTWWMTLGSAVIIAGGYVYQLFLLSKGGMEVAIATGARMVTSKGGSENEVRAINLIQETALAAGMRTPTLFILESPAINAFAAGWSEDDGVVCLTTGAIEQLSRDELHGVVAHEFSHILNGDVSLNMHLSCMIFGLQCITNVGARLLRSTRKATALTYLGLAMIGAGSVGWLGGRILQAAISRQREYLADASAVQFTRQPSGIAGALLKISRQYEDQGLRLRISEASACTVSHMLISRADFVGSDIFSTHPDIRSRVKRILGYSYVAENKSPTQ